MATSKIKRLPHWSQKRLAPVPVTNWSNDRVRVGIITPSLQLGGAEQWIIELLKSVDSEKINWGGVALLHPPHAALNTIQEVAQICPVSMGWQAAATLNHTCDVVICWGIANAGQFFWPEKKAKVLLVSHGMGEWTEKSFEGCEFADAFVAVSKCALAPIPKKLQNKASIIYNAVNPARIQAKQSRAEVRKSWGVSPQKKVLGYLGRLSGEKNPMAVAEAIKHLPKSWVGVLVGDGLQAAEVKEHARLHAGDRVLFPGKTEDIGSALNAFDAFLLPSFEEACSLALIEAWMSGVPCIATPVGMVLEQPDLVRKLPKNPTGKQIAAAVTADFKNKKTRMARVERAKAFAESDLSVKQFGKNWTDYLMKFKKDEG